jgi:cell division protein FtsB
VEARWKIAFILALALAIGFIAYTLIGPGGGGNQEQMQAELDTILKENQSLREKNRRLTLEVDALKRRRDYLEKISRDELGLVKKGEVVIHLKESQDDESPWDESQGDPSQGDSVKKP